MTRRNQWLGLSGAIVLAVAVTVGLLCLQPEIAPIVPPAATQFSADSIARGKNAGGTGRLQRVPHAVGWRAEQRGLAMKTPLAPFIPAISLRTPSTVLAAGRIRPFCAPCATVSIAGAIISIRPFPTRRLRTPAMKTCRIFTRS